MWDKRRKNIKILTWDKSESSRILASMVWVAIISIAKAIRTAAVNKQLLIDDIISPWNVHWFEQRMSRSHEIHQFTIRNSSFFNNTAQRKTKRRETTIEDHGRCALYCTATSIGRKRAIATNFKSQRPNGRTVCALPPHARYLKRGKRFFFSSSTKRRNNKQGWRTRRNWTTRSFDVTRRTLGPRINAQDESGEKQTYRMTPHSFRRTCQRYGGWRGTAPSPCLDPRSPHHTTETSLRYTVLSSPLRRVRLSPSLAPRVTHSSPRHTLNTPVSRWDSWVVMVVQFSLLQVVFWLEFIPSHSLGINIGNNMDSTFDK